jgi:hypothetical protein
LKTSSSLSASLSVNDLRQQIMRSASDPYTAASGTEQQCWQQTKHDRHANRRGSLGQRAGQRTEHMPYSVLASTQDSLLLPNVRSYAMRNQGNAPLPPPTPY